MLARRRRYRRRRARPRGAQPCACARAYRPMVEPGVVKFVRALVLIALGVVDVVGALVLYMVLGAWLGVAKRIELATIKFESAFVLLVHGMVEFVGLGTVRLVRALVIVMLAAATRRPQLAENSVTVLVTAARVIHAALRPADILESALLVVGCARFGTDARQGFVNSALKHSKHRLGDVPRGVTRELQSSQAPSECNRPACCRPMNFCPAATESVRQVCLYTSCHRRSMLITIVVMTMAIIINNENHTNNNKVTIVTPQTRRGP